MLLCLVFAALHRKNQTAGFSPALRGHHHPRGQNCFIDPSLNQRMSHWSDTIRTSHHFYLEKSRKYDCLTCVLEKTGVNAGTKHPKDLLKSDKMHSNWEFCVFKSTRTTKHNSPVFPFFFFYITKLGGKRGRWKIGGGWRSGDEWEWWFYWVLSGWVNGE